MSKNDKDNNVKKVSPEKNNESTAEQYSLNDDRRVKVISPGMMVAKRFIRNKIAMVGLIILVFMFLFSFLGGILSPYAENQRFYARRMFDYPFAQAASVKDFRNAYAETIEKDVANNIHTQATKAISEKNKSYPFKYNGQDHFLTETSPSLFTIRRGLKEKFDDTVLIGAAYRGEVVLADGTEPGYDLLFNSLKAYLTGSDKFEADEQKYVIWNDNIFVGDEVPEDLQTVFDELTEKSEELYGANDAGEETEEAETPEGEPAEEAAADEAEPEEEIDEDTLSAEIADLQEQYDNMLAEASFGTILSTGYEDLVFISPEGEFPADMKETVKNEIDNRVYQFSDTIKHLDYDLHYISNDLYGITRRDEQDYIAIEFKNIVNIISGKDDLTFEIRWKTLKAYALGEEGFTANDGSVFTINEDGEVAKNGVEFAFITNFVVKAHPKASTAILSREFIETANEATRNGETSFTLDATVYTIHKDPQKSVESAVTYTIKSGLEREVLDTRKAPTAEHWLGTDENGMDVLTRLMYGGRVSLMIGFIVEIIASLIGIVLGGISGYFGGWIDNLIMRIVDIFYCIPSLPIIMILGAAMDEANVPNERRMIYLMLILGVLGWPGLARMIRGQILSLREQEFMTATEACGVRTSRRIFKHLIPNVIPQLIVSVTMGLGGTIITEATLSFLGLGVKFPFASWGNIINSVNTQYVLTNCWFMWIPAGMLLLLTVLAFNLVGDGLRDAFDPKMKR